MPSLITACVCFSSEIPPVTPFNFTFQWPHHSISANSCSSKQRQWRLCSQSQLMSCWWQALAGVSNSSRRRLAKHSVGPAKHRVWAFGICSEAVNKPIYFALTCWLCRVQSVPTDVWWGQVEGRIEWASANSLLCTSVWLMYRMLELGKTKALLSGEIAGLFDVPPSSEPLNDSGECTETWKPHPPSSCWYEQWTLTLD